MPPSFSFKLTNPSAFFSILLFIGMGWVFSFFFERLRRAQERTEIRFDVTFEQAAVGIALVAPDGHWLRVNPKFCEIVGYRKDELVGRSFQEITHPDDLSASLMRVQQLLAGEFQTYEMEKRYIHKNGSDVWIHLSVALVPKTNGLPEYLIAIIEDIQARKEVEASLNEAKRLAKLGHWRWDVATDTHTWSDEIYSIYGRDPALPAAIYPEVQRYFTPESWAHLAATVEKALSTGEAYECDAEVVRPDGVHRWVTARGQVECDERGVVLGLHGTVQDITDRKLAEIALLESEHRYRELVQNANSAIIHWLPDGNIRFLNEYAQAFFGWKADEAIGKSVNLIVPDQETSGADLTSLVKEIAAHPECYLNVVNENICRDGRRVWMNWTNRAIRDENGQLMGILAIGSDISESKQAAEDLKRRNEELERFNQVSVGRELLMIELKGQVNQLSQELGRAPVFDLSFVDASEPPAGNPAS
jgi:PAS domain S-box-containing protein